MKITSTKDVAAQRLTCLVYGNPGIGKTSLAKTCPGRTLIISAESGLLSLAGSEIDVVEITKWSETHEVFNFLMTEEAKQTYQWIFIDSLTELGQRLIENLKTRYPDRKDALKMWGEYAEVMTGFVKAVRDIRPYSVVFTALPSVEKDDVGRTRYAVDLNGKISTRLPAFFDEVFALRMFDDEERGPVRLLQTVESDGWIAKDRSGKLATYEEPDLGIISSKTLNQN